MDYKEKLEEAKRLYELANDDQKHVLKSLFPELPELTQSEDERIRKNLITFMSTFKHPLLAEIERKEFLAWLERQKDCVHIKKDWFEHLKQSWYKEGFIDAKYSGGTSKEWTINDATILKELIGFLENETPKLQHDLTQYANWLKIQFAPNEKQGEQKQDPCENCKDICLNCQNFPCIEKKEFKQGKSALEAIKEEKVDNANKVEPKFKVGDWVVSPNGVYWHIDKISNNRYEVISNTGERSNWSLDTNIYHRFTTADAKDGDVLAFDDNTVVIFKDFYNKTTFHAYCHIEDGTLSVSEEDFPDWWWGENFKPATKEQRDTLIKAMADAGYTFDFEKKELKLLITNGGDFETENCEQKPAWSEKDELSCFESALFTAFSDIWQSYLSGEEVNVEQWAKEHSKELLESAKEELKEHNSAWSGEDNKNLEKTIWYVEKGGKLIFAKTDELVSWLKSLKGRVQPKQEWSEEDNYNLQCMIAKVTSDIQKGNVGRNNELIDWLNSLKQRINNDKKLKT